MKKLKLLFAILVPLAFTSCIVVDNTPGPRGLDGRAYFGVDYDHQAPYSYWDNNPSIPYNPVLGDYYRTAPGLYRFEYFINEYDYWYGTYEVWINRGGPGGPQGQPGFNGRDSFLMLICDPNGFYEYRDNWKMNVNEPLVIERKDGEFNYKITIQKGNVKDRPAQEPKYIN